jgi:hypothetical protein
MLLVWPLQLEGHPGQKGELRLLRYCEFSSRSLLNLGKSQSGEALDESFEAGFADRCAALALGIQRLIVALMPEDALPATLDVAFDQIATAGVCLVIGNQIFHALPFLSLAKLF